MKAVRLGVVAGVMLAGAAGPLAAQSAYVNFEGKQTRPICLSPDGTLLYAVNTADARLSVFDLTRPLSPFLIAEIPVGIEPVSVNTPNNDEAWVVNEVSDSISVVSLSSRLVVATLHVKDEPNDVVFANGRAFVSASRNNQIAVFDVATRTLLTRITLAGENPRALAVGTNGATVYAAFALSGNGTTLVPAAMAPPQMTNGTPAMDPSLPPPPQVGLIVKASDPAWTNVIQYRMPDHDVVEIDTATLTVLRYFANVGAVNLGLAVNPTSGDVFVAGTDANNLTHFEPALRGSFATNQLSRIALSDGAVTTVDLNAGFDPANFTPENRSNALAQPAALLFEPDGSHVYVAAFGSDRLARVNASDGSVVSRIELCPTAAGAGSDPRRKRGPRGLALLPGTALYVLNRVANTLSIIDPGTHTLLKEVPVGSHDPSSTTIREGRGFLYDAKLSGNGTVSCATCHVDSEMDLLAWDLGDPQGDLELTTALVSGLGVPATFTNHPMKGPMATQTLRGLSALDPFHWRGDRSNFLHFNGAFATILGGAPLSAPDMDTYRDFINTVVFQPNPNQNLNRTLPAVFNGADPEAGRLAFINSNYTAGLRCNSCHALPVGTDRSFTPALALQQSQSFKVPHLRNIYQKTGLNRTADAESVGGFGFLHDGSFADIFTFLSQPVFGTFASNTIIKSNLQAFLLCFDSGTAPAVGYSRTLTAANVTTPAVSNDWGLLEAQVTGPNKTTNVDLIITGTVDGLRRSLLYQPQSTSYRPDTTNLANMTRAQLTAKVLAGDTLTLMGVPPWSGHRMALDRDLNGVLNGDEPPPGLRLSATGAALALSWPFNAVGYRLEDSPNPAAMSWSPTADAVEIVGTNNVVTTAPTDVARFFRLRRQ